MTDNSNTIIETDIVEEEESEPKSGSKAIAKDIMPETLPILLLQQRPSFPKMLVPLILDDKEQIKIILENNQNSKKTYIGLILEKENRAELQHMPTTLEDFHTVGVAGKVLQVSPIQDEQEGLQVLVQLIDRFDLREIVSTKPVVMAKAHYWNETLYETNEELKAYSVAIIDSIKELVKLDPLFKEGLAMVLERLNVNDPGALADFSASMTTANDNELQEILEEHSIRTRIEKSLILLKREIEISKLKVEISGRIEERLSKQQREFFLKEQLKEIKKELGLSKDDTESHVEMFQNRLKKLTLSDEGRERIDEELEKLKLLEPSSAEYNVTRAYLDWLTVLPWGVYTDDNYDIKNASRILNRDHYGLKDVKDRILELISVGIIKGDLAGSIILLVGPPGVGKTSIGQSIAHALGRKFYRFSLGGMRDEAEIKGHRRTYIGALPGKFVQALKTCKTSNPVIMLDEIDKIGASFRGDPASALLEVLDPEQNRDFLDHYLDIRFDLSKILFICTANQLETIPRPLLDRMEMISLSGYIQEEKFHIAKKYLIPKQLKAHGLTKKQLVFEEEAILDIIDGYAREAGVRGLENNIKKIMRKAAKMIVKNNPDQIEIKKSKLNSLLGRRIFSKEQMFKRPRVGVVMGLAYTSMGGTTLYIEALPVPSKAGAFKQTGQLGKVMIESSEIAYTYIRSLFREDDKAKEFFAGHLLHLHVPAGATPKDGPSAGVTMACAIYSLLTNRAIIDDIAMTGELTLTGLVMPIGGVKEKVIAAKRVGVTRVILPEENRRDFQDLPSPVKKGIQPYFAASFEDVKKICFP